MNMVTLSWTVHTRYLLWKLQWLTTNLTGVTIQDQVQDTTMNTETGKADPDHSLIFKDITAQAIAIHIEATLDHNTEIEAAITEATHDNLIPTTEDTVTDLTMTHLTNHIADHLNTEALQTIDPDIIVGHTHNQPTGLQVMNHIDQSHNPAGQGDNHIPRKTWGWRLRIHTWIFTALMFTPVTQERNLILWANQALSK